MAVTKIKPIKSTLSKALDYIENPDKTDGKMLISSFGCSYETADIEFGYTLSQALDISPYRIHKISSCPKMPIPIFVFQVGMPVKYHQAALSFQVAHNLGYAVLRRDAYQHVDVVWACLCFYDFHALLLAQLPHFGANTTWY